MKLLLDTHLLLWASEGARLSPTAVGLIDDPVNSLFFSAVSIWEVAIKASLKRHDFGIGPAELRRALIAEGYEEIYVTGVHAAAVVDLPDLHRDPFDRLLIAQAISERITLLTVDQVMLQYPGPIRSAA